MRRPGVQYDKPLLQLAGLNFFPLGFITWMHLLFQDLTTLDPFYLNKLHPCVSYLGTNPTLWKPTILGPLKTRAQASSGASGCLTTSPAAPLALSIRRLPKSGWMSLVSLLLDASKDKLTELCLLWILLLLWKQMEMAGEIWSIIHYGRLLQMSQSFPVLRATVGNFPVPNLFAQRP